MVFSMLTACGDNAVPAMATVGADSGLSAYELAVQHGYDGTLEDWLQSLQGKSAYEIAVEHGYTGTEEEWISRLNNLVADGGTYVKTASFNSAGQLILTLSDGTTLNIGGGLALKGADGANGKDGTNGSNGANGKDGRDGKDGKDGTNGKDGVSVAGVSVNNEGELIISFSDGKATNVGKVVGTSGLNGKDGLSAYEIAVITGATTAATEAEWLESLKGTAGADGQTPYVGTNGNWWIGTTDTGVTAGGRNGTDGATGKSAYEIAKENGCTLSEAEWLASLKGADGQNGSNGKSAYEIALEAGLTTAATEAEWLDSLKGATGAAGQDGRDGKDGKDGVNGKDGIAGKDGIDGKDGDTPSIGTNGNWWIGTTDTGVKAAGPQGEQGLKGDKGDKGETGAQGANGRSAYEIAIEKNLITNAVTEEQWLASLKGEKGAQGEQGVGIQNITLNNGTMTITLTDNTQFQFENIGSASSGGTTPQIRINTQTNEWEISSDSGNSWVSTGVKATGEKGAVGADGAKGEDGTSPKVQINAVTNEWEISVNNGLSWTSTGVKATGTDGKDGDTPFVGNNGNWWIGTTDTGVKAAGQDGQDGKDGQNGADGRDGINGKDGKDGVSVTGVTINDENKLVITLSEGDPIIIDKSLMGATGAAGADGKDGNGISSVTLTPDFYLVFHYTDGTNSGKLGPIKGEKGDNGDDGVGIANVSLDANGNLYITYSNTNVPVLLGNARGPKGDTGDTGPAGPKGDTGADGKDGVGIKNAYVNSERHLILELTDGTTIDAGYVGVSEEPTATHTVIFKDWDGTELKRETVADGASATAPSDPIRAGYVFAGWDKSFTNVTADTIVTATYTVSAALPALKVSSITAAPGATKVTVMVSLENNPGFLTMALEMSFDSDVLTLTRVSNGADFTDYNFTGPKNKVSGCRAAWFSTDLPEEILDGDVMTLQFTVANNAASGRYPITISCPDDGSTLDGNKNVIALANAIGYITVG